MNSAYRPVVLVLVVVGAMVAFTGVRKLTEPKEIIPWRKTLAEAREESAGNRKPILAYFTASWCGPCQTMKRETWADPRVAEALRNFVPVKIDVDQFPAVAQEFGVDGIPRVQVIHPDGRRGPARVGFISAEDLSRWLQGARSG